ncbi:MAG: hypothetical protein QOJ45_2693 [Verrucomicrobiota bacterium]
MRIALGATRGDVVRLVLKDAFWLILTGLSIGLPLTFAAGRLLGNQLYGMNPYNPAVTTGAVVALGLSALLASIVPAIRASLISPLDALRAESRLWLHHGSTVRPLARRGRRRVV